MSPANQPSQPNQSRVAASTMHRRGHKKSRNGCLECKRRHMKCDETRPQCANCTTVHRACQYLEPQGVQRVPYQSTSPSSISPAASSTAASSTTSYPFHTSPPSQIGTASPISVSPAANTNTRSTYDDGQTPGGSPASALSRHQTTPQTSTPTTPHLNSDHFDDVPVSVLHSELAFNFSDRKSVV